MSGVRRNGTINEPDFASWFERDDSGGPMWALELAPRIGDRPGLETTADIVEGWLAPA